LVSFNIGVELGQLIALSVILIAMGFWRRHSSFWKHAYTANVMMMSAGFLLVGDQITGFIIAS
ncbi:MAG: HupE/UreJ family protein, partial [Cohaesibacter sp.]|nr:HupE/UreJ family protein [Cohaesibacter sp.]